ncbi:MAG: type II toxin-antitoxin system RelE/ParE family toxin [bacterium]|nr:type II toxin-antitoxin system RelE/ParE family toxin [bacterium]
MARVTLNSVADREYRKLPKDIRLAIDGVLLGTFARDPLSSLLHIRKLHPPLPGYRLRIGEYRVLYTLKDDEAQIYRIRHRKDAYR